MSFNQASALEAQPPQYRDDPETLPSPAFDSLAENLSVKLFGLTSSISRLRQQIELLGTKRDTERVRERVSDLLEEVRDGFKDAGDGVRKLAKWEDLNASQKYTQQKINREFQSSGTEFQTLQRLALDKQRASASAARSALSASGNQPPPGEPYTDDPSSDNTGANPPQQQQQAEQQQDQLRLADQSEVDFQESLIVERESEIRAIETSVGELNELFRDVALMVHNQGEDLQTISGNVQDVARDTRQADVELRSASRYQKKARGRACCLLVILAVVLVVIILAAVLG